jgi:hypothetical protein
MCCGTGNGPELPIRYSNTKKRQKKYQRVLFAMPRKRRRSFAVSLLYNFKRIAKRRAAVPPTYATPNQAVTARSSFSGKSLSSTRMEVRLGMEIGFK